MVGTIFQFSWILENFIYATQLVGSFAFPFLQTLLNDHITSGSLLVATLHFGFPASRRLMLSLISSCIVLTLAMSSAVSPGLDSWRKDSLLIKLFSSIKLYQSFYCLKPQTALHSHNSPCSSVIPGSNLNIHSIEYHVPVSMNPVVTAELLLNPCKPGHHVHSILWQVFPQPNCWESSYICWSWTCHLQVSLNALPTSWTSRDSELLSLVQLLHVTLDFCQVTLFSPLCVSVTIKAALSPETTNYIPKLHNKRNPSIMRDGLSYSKDDRQ